MKHYLSNGGLTKSCTVKATAIAAGIVLGTVAALAGPFPFPSAMVAVGNPGNESFWVQASPFNPNQIYFHKLSNYTSNSITVETSTLTPDGMNPTGYSQTSALTTLNPSTYYKGSSVYKEDAIFVSQYGTPGSISLVDPTTGTTSMAWDLNTSPIARTDITSTNWAPNSVAVDRTNNKLYMTNGWGYTNGGLSVVRFSIDPDTYALTHDLTATIAPSVTGEMQINGRQIVLPDGYVLATTYDPITPKYEMSVIGFNGMATDQAALEASVAPSGLLAYTYSEPRALAFRADPSAPSGIGYVYAGFQRYNAADDYPLPADGYIYAYDYEGSGVLGVFAGSFNVKDYIPNVGIVAIDWTADGSMLIVDRYNDRLVYAFFQIPEPSALALFALAGGALCLRRRRS